MDIIYNPTEGSFRGTPEAMARFATAQSKEEFHLRSDGDNSVTSEISHKGSGRTASSSVPNPSQLTPVYYDTWRYVCENDTGNGVHLSAVSRDLGINNSTAGSRMGKLVDKGFLRRGDTRGVFHPVVFPSPPQISLRAIG
jgi:hypothetical protein